MQKREKKGGGGRGGKEEREKEKEGVKDGGKRKKRGKGWREAFTAHTRACTCTCTCTYHAPWAMALSGLWTCRYVTIVHIVPLCACNKKVTGASSLHPVSVSWYSAV